MSDSSTSRMISAYMEEASAPLFLSGFFKSPPQNFHNSEKVELDVMRDEEEVAVVVQDMTVDGRDNESTLYVNKGFTPPVFKERGAINAYSQIKRQAGQTPFENPDYGANAAIEAFRIFRKLENKIRRSVEWMASQVLQTGTLTLPDSAGVTLYTLDFKPKATHHVTVGTAWAADGSTGNPLTDIESLCHVVRTDGKKSPTKLIFGKTAFRYFLANSKVAERFRRDGLPLGSLTPQTRGEGASYQGDIWIGSYQLEVWLYDAHFKHPATGTMTPYIADDKIVVMSDDGRLDLSFGGIPRIAPPDPRAMPFLPRRMSSGERGIDLITNAWITPDGENLMVSAASRPLTIPTAIDTFGSLDVVP